MASLYIARNASDAKRIAASTQRAHASSQLALDADAYGILKASGVQVTQYDDWLSNKDRSETATRGRQLNITWYRSAFAQFSAFGYCWPELDAHAGQSMWSDALTGPKKALATSLPRHN